MRQKLAYVFLVIFPFSGLFGCAETIQAIGEGAAIGATMAFVEVATGDPELAEQVGQELLAKSEEERQTRELLSKLPAGWQCPGGDLYWSEDVDCMVYTRPDKDWVKFNGVFWVDPTTNTPAQPLIASSPTETDPQKAVAAVPQKASAPPASMEVKPVSLNEARKT